jgi:hypothetical protein
LILGKQTQTLFYVFVSKIYNLSLMGWFPRQTLFLLLRL